jgi:hypothetical protein
MNSVIGTWRLVAETATDEAGQPRPTLVGPLPLGFITFTAAGRMIVAVSDGRPDPIDGPRSFYSYCGSYTFDGTRLVTRVDGASDPRLRAAPQVRGTHFDGDRLTLRLLDGFFPDADRVMRELTWGRVA